MPPPEVWDDAPMLISMDMADLDACEVKDPIADIIAQERIERRAAKKAEAKRIRQEKQDEKDRLEAERIANLPPPL